VSNERTDLSGGKRPGAGDAARQAGREGDAVNEANGIRTVPRGEYQGLAVNLRSTRGARLVQTEPETDWSARKASDYLPPQLKAELIAAGKLTEDGHAVPVDATTSASAPRPVSEENLPAATVTAGPAEGRGAWNAITGFFRRLFS